MPIPRVSFECVDAVMDKSMRVPMATFGVELLEELVEDQPHLMMMISFLLTNIVAEGKDKEIAAKDAVQAMCIVGVVWKAIKAQIEADDMETSEDCVFEAVKS